MLHPHVGTMVETRGDVERVLKGSAIRLCLDTGHLLIGGTDPLQLAREVPGRIAHTHLKDVDAAMAARVQAGELTYTEAVRQGMYTPLGSGDIDIAGIVTALRSNGFDGWFVLEQDTILDDDPVDEGRCATSAASACHWNGVCRVVRHDPADRRPSGRPASPSSPSSGPPRTSGTAGRGCGAGPAARQGLRSKARCGKGFDVDLPT